jgi:diguanylate cyclase (GGDEF)-like protein
MTAAQKHRRSTVAAQVAHPESLAELFDWVRRQSGMSSDDAEHLVDAIVHVMDRHERLWQQSKADALQAMSVGFADRMRRMREELSARDTTVSSITRYFETLVADLTDRADRDPKTRLMNFRRFSERLEAFLALEQRGSWCAVGLVDIRSFKQYNDVFGHALGDRVIDRVARLLREQVRANDVLAHDALTDGWRELHARFGGDEFCFLLPTLDSSHDAWLVAERFRKAVEEFDWALEDERLIAQHVTVDVGVVTMRLGPLEARRHIAPQLAQDLLLRADHTMYAAKGERSAHVHVVRVVLSGQTLIDLEDEPSPGRDEG